MRLRSNPARGGPLSAATPARPDRTSRTRAIPRGTALVEVVVAAGVSAVALGPVAVLLAISASSLQLARETSTGATLAMRKMEQLAGALWAVDTAGLPITDLSSDFTTVPPASSGGRGLSPSPADALERNAAGFVDYLDADGRWVGTGAVPPAGTYFVRRWSIDPAPDDPADSLVIQVLVVPRHRLAPPGHAHTGREPGVVRFVSARTRRSP